MTSRRGQVMVEAAGAIGLLFLVFVCSYHTLRIALDKIRSLDAVDHLARKRQVHTSSGPAIQEIVLTFHPYRLPSRSWTSVMRVTMPNPSFLKVSWPGARSEPPVSQRTLTKEATVTRLRVLAHSDAAIDTVEQATAVLKGH